MKKVETNDNQVLSIMVKSCCFTELSVEFDSCNLLLIPQNSVTPHSSGEREFAMTVWGLVQGNVWVQISLCLTRNSRCFYITNCHVAGGQIKPRDGTVDPPPAWTDRLLAQADKPFAADLLIVIVGGLLVLWSDLHVQCHTLWSVLMDSKVNYRKVCASFV